MHYAEMTIEQLSKVQDTTCACGRVHKAGLAFVRIGPGATEAIPQALACADITHPFIVCDENTHRVAWPVLEKVLHWAEFPYTLHILRGEHLEPDERAMGSLVMAYDRQADGVLAVGSGVINDCCKVLAHAVGVPSVVYATAPSMDGYASNSSSMIQDGVKVSLLNACPAAIVGDIDIIREAPQRMLWAGLGDMLAKYIALCEWRISHIVTGEYYCEEVAGLMRAALAKIVESADGLAARDAGAVQAVMEGLVLSGIAMAFAQVSRPASGLEHYFSHVWEMMALERGERADLHGIQVGVGTYLTLRLYEGIRGLTPDREKALAFVAGFDNAAWEAQVREVFGSVAETIIEREHAAYHKNSPVWHEERLEQIVEKWPELLRIMEEELPQVEAVYGLMMRLGMPVRPGDIGVSRADAEKAFVASRDIRDKYLTSSLLWDLGVLYEVELPE